MENLFSKNSQLKGIPEEAIRKHFQNKPQSSKSENLRTLLLWQHGYSPHSSYISGQTITVDSGLVKATIG